VKIAYLGTPPFAVLPLDALRTAGHEIACVVAQPDRPAGRGQEVKEPATKAWARGHGVPVLQPEKVRDGRLAADLRALAPDLLVVAAYGRILGEDLLGLAPFGAVNVHASLLPRWRGAAPVQWALAEGDAETGVTLMQMDAGLDTGDVLLQRVVQIREDDSADTLLQRVGEAGADGIVEALPLLAAGRLTPVRQDASRATHARILEKEDGRLDFTLPAARLANRIRGFSPWPGSFTLVSGKLLKVHAARAIGPDDPMRRGTGDLAPGEVRAVRDGILVGCGDGSALLLAVVQLEGKRRQLASEFVMGHGLPPSLRLGA
jgi:methionyl-tRNA formyltransferase